MLRPATLGGLPQVVGERPFFKIEEHGVEAEEHESDGGAEPVEGSVSESGWIDPTLDGEPFVVVAFVQWVEGIGLCADC